ncbi:MAG: hypothetical protein JXK94_11085 [Deltaproteobacteria bacterium]|nr:hypothetical protein [Deltaproteobacteria bacterium]
MKEIHHATLKAFVQEVLGCGCPEEVFENMSCRKEYFSKTEGTLIDVGGRLLVFLWQMTDSTEVLEELKDILKAGLAKRDTQGFNRLRLVLLAENTAQSMPDPQAKFLELIAKDTKVHFHILKPETVPTFILN